MRWTIVAIIRLLLFAALVIGWAYLFIVITPITMSTPIALNFVLYIVSACGAFGYANTVDRMIDNSFSYRDHTDAPAPFGDKEPGRP